MSKEGLCEHLAILQVLVGSSKDGQNEFPMAEMAHLSEGIQSQAPAAGPGAPVFSHPQCLAAHLRQVALFHLLPSFPLSHSQQSHGTCGLVTGREVKLARPKASDPDSEVASGTLMEMFTRFQCRLTLPWAPAGTN